MIELKSNKSLPCLTHTAGRLGMSIDHQHLCCCYNFPFLFRGVGCGSHPVTTDDGGGIGPDYFPLFLAMACAISLPSVSVKS